MIFFSGKPFFEKIYNRIKCKERKIHVGINNLKIRFFKYAKILSLLSKEPLVRQPETNTIRGTSKFLIAKSQLGIGICARIINASPNVFKKSR